MTDLINRVNDLEAEVIHKLIEKYKHILPYADIKHEEEVPYLLYAINLTVNYINANHNDETPEWKTWGVVLIKKLFQKEKITTREEVYQNIDKFYEHKKSEYKKYVDNIAMYSDEFYRDAPFVDKFIEKL